MEEERSTAVEVQQDECEDYAVDVTTASSWYKNVSYDDAKIFIRTNIESAARSFIAIGYYLKLIRDGELYREEGHENIWDFAMAEYGISKSTASRYMSMPVGYIIIRNTISRRKKIQMRRACGTRIGCLEVRRLTLHQKHSSNFIRKQVVCDAENCRHPWMDRISWHC